MKVRAATVTLVVLGAVLSGLAHWKYRLDLREAEANFRRQARAETEILVSSVEHVFESTYRNLHAIAQLPGVRALSPMASTESPAEQQKVDEPSTAVAREIYRGLNETVAVARLHIVPFPFDPDRLGQNERIPDRPSLSFPRALPAFGAKPRRGRDQDARVLRLLLEQLQWLQYNYPTAPGIGEENAPAITGHEIGPADEADAPADRRLVYSVPFYGPDGRLRGCVSAEIPIESIQQLLDDGHSVVAHPSYGVFLEPYEPQDPEGGRKYWSRGIADPEVVYSEVLPLSIVDAQENWVLWTRRTDAAFNARSDVRNAEVGSIGALLLTWLGVGALLIFLGKLDRLHVKLAAQNRDLEQRVQERTEAYERASVLAQQATEAKSAFLAKMSHEIRTPMSAILGFSDLLGDPETTEQKRTEAVGTIRRNGRHLLNLINDILDLSKIEAGQLEMERVPVKIPVLLGEVVDLLRQRAYQRSTTLATEIRGEVPRHIESDPTRLRQALVNLVGNAIKFTEGGDVRIVVDSDIEAQLITFRVLDNGIGMTSAQVRKVFLPFAQADRSTTRQFGGTGLGLTITQSIARLLGGDITVASEPGKGSTFSFTVATGSLENVPLIRQEEGTVEPPETLADPEELPHIDGRVLLVEDGPDNQAIISYVLRRAGAQVMIASNGQEGAEVALAAQRAGRPFDVVLMDMQMPILDGYEATRWLREEGYEGQIIALTAHAMVGDVDKCLAAGCDHYLSKPVERETLVMEIAHRAGLRSIAKPAPLLRGARRTQPVEEAADEGESGEDGTPTTERTGEHTST